MAGSAPRVGPVVLAVALALSGCGTDLFGEAGSGRIETIEPEVTAYSRLVAESAFEVEVSVGDGYDLVVRADDNVVDDVDVSVRGGTLTLGLDGNYRNVTLEADLQIPPDALSEITASGAARVSALDALAAASFEIGASGASEVTMDLEAEQLTVSASGASTIVVAGSGGRIDADASGASTLRLDAFIAASARARADGASTIEITASDSLDAEASGASTIRYSGNPADVSRDESGASTVEAA